MKTIYLDYNATTPIDPQVIEVMMPYLREHFGNPSSSHDYGLKTRMAVEQAREQVAKMIGCSPSEIVFTGGGTEANNMAIRGAAFAKRDKGRHIIISAIEHPAVTEVADYLKDSGFEISIAPVDGFGTVSPDSLRSLIRPDTVLVSVMHSNNEIGTIQPIKELAAIANEHGILFHTDAAQSVGKTSINVKDLGVDMLSIAGHKLYAPKGVGALYVRNGVKLQKLMYGANHEQDRRPGTENVPYLVALGMAAELVTMNLEGYAAAMKCSRDNLEVGLLKEFPDLRINGHRDNRLPNTLNVCFRNLGAGAIMRNLEGVAVSAGAACHAGSGKSGTLQALNLPPEYALGALRISTGRHTTQEEVEEALQRLVKAIRETGNGKSARQVVRIAEPEIEAVSSHPKQGLAIVSGHWDDNEEKEPDSQLTYSLTSYAYGMGCGCKMRPADLEFILKDMTNEISADILVNAESRDDAAVYKISDNEAIVETVDFFTPMVDDAYSFGAIAAANAISDIYAMGAEPAFALNLVAFPVDRLPLDVLREIMRGASDKASEAGIPVLGGHSIEDSGVKFGMVVTGRVKPDDLVTNAGAKVGDLLILTKPLGNGILSKAYREGMDLQEAYTLAVRQMESLNKHAASLMKEFGVNACTDITGFGLAGHLHEMAAASEVDAVIYYDKLPVLPMAEKMSMLGMVPGSTEANISFAADWADLSALTMNQKAIVCDAQTSGGLLMSLPAEMAAPMVRALQDKNMDARIIGEMSSRGTGYLKFCFS